MESNIPLRYKNHPGLCGKLKYVQNAFELQLNNRQPNHSSDLHEWFIKSEARDPEYEDFYIWHDGKPGLEEGDERLPPNNWVSVFYGSAW